VCVCTECKKKRSSVFLLFVLCVFVCGNITHRKKNVSFFPETKEEKGRIEKKTKLCTTLSNGYLGSRNDEERSELR